MCLKQLPLGGSWRDLPVLFQKLHLLMLFATLEEEGGCPPRVGRCGEALAGTGKFAPRRLNVDTEPGPGNSPLPQRPLNFHWVGAGKAQQATARSFLIRSEIGDGA